MANVSDSSRPARSSFQQVAAAFLSQPGLPFAGVLSAERVERIFAKQGNLFGVGQIYSTPLMVRAFLGQVLRDGKLASCQAAVACVVTYRELFGLSTPTSDTGDYCRARAKLSEAALHEFTVEIAAEVEAQADVKWLWKGWHAKLVDGITFTMPDTLELREIQYRVVAKGRRTQTLTVVTTLTDAEVDSPDDIAQLYGFRWNAELDIRAIKPSLNLCHVRCKSPEMVRNEVWTTLLGDNLIRTAAAAAALLHDKQPRQISFTSTCQYVLSSWMLFSCNLIDTDRIEAHCRTLLSQIADCKVANRPGRIEPRVLKRRRHGYKLMQEPRAVLRARLKNGNQ